jgi:hypothetical protein
MRTDLLLVIQSKKAHFGQEKFGLPQLPDGTVTHGTVWTSGIGVRTNDS